jgi:hypothetical protein
MRFGTMRVLLTEAGSIPARQRRTEPTELNRYTISRRLIRPAHPAWRSLLRRAISDQLSAVSF